ncbi:MAG: hypothetical protein FJX23_10890, partial [Alphaproteobacteria bacterium]|nr:hypothetical protein [Alphaproteobacteria bacterium]
MTSMKRILSLSLMATLLWSGHAKAQEPVQIAAVVNNSIITTDDLGARIRLAVATSGIEATPEVQRRMAVQVLRGLVDEQLQLQEAARLNINVPDEEVDAAITSINAQRRLPDGAFQQFLASRGVPVETVESQARAQIAWSKVVAQNLRSRVRVSTDEINRERESIAAGKEVTEYNLSSIVLPVDKPEDDAETQKLAQQLATDITGGANFTALAAQFSAGGAELVEQNQYRWVQLHQLEPVLARAVSALEKDGVSPILRSATGYHIIKLNDKRQSNLKKVADSEVLLKQIVMKLKETAEPQEAQLLLGIAREVARHPGNCMQEQVAGMEAMEDLKFEVKYERVEFRELQGEIQAMLANLRVGDVTEPFATPEGIHLVQLCERVEKPAELPPVEQIQSRLFQQKLQMESAKRLRDL